jgi:hypothetical protein
MASLPEDGTAALTVRQLSATLAHELNNVVASLRGFVQLGSAMAKGNPLLQTIFTEGDLSAERIAALAADLEVLAAPAAEPVPVVPGDILKMPQTGNADLRHPVPPVHWDSEARTAVRVDPSRFLPTLGVLRRLAGTAAAPLRFRVVDTDSPGSCLACGQALPRRSAWLLQELPQGKLQALTGQPTRPQLSMDRLRLAVFGQCIHTAGGHLIVGSHPDSVGWVLPIT